MDVILLERIAKLGELGDVVAVKPGYARNYLLPQKKALRATDENKEYFEREKASIEKTNEGKRGEAEQTAAGLDGQSFVLLRQAGESGHLYGSVSARDIAAAANEKGFAVTRQQVAIDRPIKELGLHEAAIAPHPELTVTVTINVALSEEEAEAQALRGIKVGDEEPDADAVAAAAAAAVFEAASDEEAPDEAEPDEAEPDEAENAEDTPDSQSADEEPQNAGESEQDSGEEAKA